MDLLILAASAIVLGIILTAMGLSFISESLNALEYNNRYTEWGVLHTSDYYNNPLCRINSKWFYYRPKGWVLVSKGRWADIEKNIGIKINESIQVGRKIGYRDAVEDIQDMVGEEQARIAPSSPYMVLNVEATTPLEEIEVQYLKLLKLYDPASSKFEGLDSTFEELATIRCQQILKAWKQINLGVGQRTFSKGDI